MRRVAGAVVATALLAACTSTPGTSAPIRSTVRPSPLVDRAAPRLAVTVQQQRVDATTRVVGVNTTNRETSPVHVSAVRLSGAGLDSGVTPKDTNLPPGLTVALRIPYGRPRCDDRAVPLTAHLRVDGRWVDYPVDGAGQREVRRLLDTDCAGIHLAATAAVHLAGPYRRVVVGGEPYLRGRLLMLRRSAGSPVDLRSLGGSVLIDLRPVDRLVDLAAIADRAVTPVLLGSTGRCDQHGLSQATQTFLLSAYVRLGNEPDQRVVLVPPKPVQDRVLGVVDAACGTLR